MSNLKFYPNLTPKEVIQAGAFGGCYFGSEIDEHVEYDYTGLFNSHFDGVDTSLYMGEKYSPKLNRFKVRSGMNYDYWKDMKWMHEDDPYGWFEWYCKYSIGRRHQDDDRQIRRWQDFCGQKGRWRTRIYSMIHQTGDWNISPRIQQSLLHWGYRVNEEDYSLWCKMNNKVAPEEWCEYGGLPSPSFYQ